jgi:hypothetical protein
MKLNKRRKEQWYLQNRDLLEQLRRKAEPDRAHEQQKVEVAFASSKQTRKCLSKKKERKQQKRSFSLTVSEGNDSLRCCFCQLAAQRTRNHRSSFFQSELPCNFFSLQKTEGKTNKQKLTIINSSEQKGEFAHSSFARHVQSGFHSCFFQSTSCRISVLFFFLVSQ